MIFGYILTRPEGTGNKRFSAVFALFSARIAAICRSEARSGQLSAKAFPSG
jgi:hypothetical protein